MGDEVVYYGASLIAVQENLTPGKKYTYRVKATNMVGDGDWSGQFTFLIVNKPSPPLNPLILSFDNT
jgi:hypothetical protein